MSLRSFPLLVATLLATSSQPFPAHGSDALVRYENDRLTVHGVGTPIRDVLDELEDQSGATMDLRALQDRAVTYDFDRIPLDEALHRLLDGQNFVAEYAIVRDQAGQVVGSRLSGLEIVGPAGEHSTASRPTGRPLPGVTKPPARAAIEQYGDVLHRNREVRLDESQALAEALGTTKADITEVFVAAFQHEDVAVRTDAARTMARVFEADRQMQSFGGSGADVEQMAAAVQAVAGPHAEEFMQTMSASLRTPALRDRNCSRCPVSTRAGRCSMMRAERDASATRGDRAAA